MGEERSRWKGRNARKDLLREQVWSRLRDSNVGVGEIWDSIPDYVGAMQAAENLASLPIWHSAKVVKSNPDNAQLPVRHRALKDGKILYMPVPNLSKDYPYVKLDPQKLTEKEIPLEIAATIDGAITNGEKVQFDEILPMDILVVGCVAVSRKGGRTGKGGGFADLELGIFSELNLVRENASVVTTVHDLQIVGDEELTLQPHDFPLDWVITPTQSFRTENTAPRPTGVVWDAVQPDQYRDIPVLNRLRSTFEGHPRSS